MDANRRPVGGSPEPCRTVHYRHVLFDYVEKSGVEYLVRVRRVDHVAHGQCAYTPPPTED